MYSKVYKNKFVYLCKLLPPLRGPPPSEMEAKKHQFLIVTRCRAKISCFSTFFYVNPKTLTFSKENCYHKNIKFLREHYILNVGEASRKRILELCQKNNITINKLATISGVTQSTLNNIVSGRNNSATVSTIKKLCDGLNITIVDFFNTEDFLNLEQEIK